MKLKNIIIIAITVVICILLVAYLIYEINQPKQLVGNDKDSHGCIPSAGYTWCDAKQKCLRPWEENCTNQNNTKNTPENKIYCTTEQKKPQVCPYSNSPACGWYSPKIPCYKYPCSEQFSGPCFACLDPKIDSYTTGNCPA